MAAAGTTTGRVGGEPTGPDLTDYIHSARCFGTGITALSDSARNALARSRCERAGVTLSLIPICAEALVPDEAKRIPRFAREADVPSWGR